MVRREKSAVLTDLPTKSRRAIYLDTTAVSDALVRSENTMYDDFLAGKKTDLDRVNSVMRVRVQLACLKAPQVLAYAEMILKTEQKICIFAYHRQLLTELVAGLAHYGVRVVSGATSPTSRQARVDEFQNDPEVRVFIGAIQAAGVGITLTASSYVIMAEASWTPGECLQAEDRCHRIGTVNPVMVDYLIYPRSADERVLKIVGEKASQIDLCLNS